jgi:predicted transcriptional regulator
LILEKLSSLLFELSSCDRLSILKELVDGSIGVTKLSKKLGLTTQETSRQVFRLKEAGLLHKDHRGLYCLTSYAKLALNQLEGLDFLSRHKEYFKSHSLAHIPEDLILRIGDLADATYLSNVSQAFYGVERLIKEAENHIWLVSDQISFGICCELAKALERGTKNRVIQTKSFVYLSSYVRDFWKFYEKNIVPIEQRTWAAGTLEDRLDDQVDVFLFVSEKQAAVAFPLNNGKFDYLVFSGSGKRFHSWCSDAFNYYWPKARPLGVVIKEPCEWVIDNPEALSALERIIEGQEVRLRKDLASGLERMQLTRRGNLTRLGFYVHNHLRQGSLRKA